MATLKNPRVGVCMAMVVSYVKRHPGCTQQEVAIQVGPNGSHNYGSRSVQRTMAAGLVDPGWDGRRYNLTLTVKGLELVRSWDA